MCDEQTKSVPYFLMFDKPHKQFANVLVIVYCCRHNAIYENNCCSTANSFGTFSFNFHRLSKVPNKFTFNNLYNIPQCLVQNLTIATNPITVIKQ